MEMYTCINVIVDIMGYTKYHRLFCVLYIIYNKYLRVELVRNLVEHGDAREGK